MKNVRIYQLPVENKAKFMGLEFVTENNIMPKLEDYNKVYEYEAEDEVALDDIYRKFNIAHPADFTGHSLSVSDIVEVDGKYYYCDDYGWEEVTDLFPMPTLVEGEEYECVKDYLMEDGSIAYKAGKTYKVLNSYGHLGIDEGGCESHKMSEERDFYLYFKKSEPKKQRTITIYAGLLHFAKNGNLLHGATKVGTWFVDNLWEKQGGRRDKSGNLTVEKMYYAKLDGYDRSYFGYTRKDLKQMLEGKQAKITLNTITFRPEDVPQEVA